jgi:hypothetical protein
MRTIFFNAQHSPIGAFASFTVGAKGALGGLAMELGRPANQSVYIGAESRTRGRFQAFPFFAQAANAEAEYTIDSPLPVVEDILSVYEDREISREITPCTDSFRAQDLTVRIINPVASVPDPADSDVDALKLALVPAVLVELTLDNRDGVQPRKVFFGQTTADITCGIRHIEGPGFAGFANGRGLAIVGSQQDGVFSGNSFAVESVLSPQDPANLKFMLGDVSLVLAEAQPGELKKVRLALCVHKAGYATTGQDASYLYNRWFPDIESVAEFALARFDELLARSETADRSLDHPGLNPSQAFMLALTLKSYYGSTQLLDYQGKPLWVVNEGEYRMMNTFDLTVDQLFYELRMNPWTVSNVLDQFVNRYSYRESIGGIDAIAFTHDMGVANQFSRAGYSSYEMGRLTGCFSYMSHEELVNWVLCAALYVLKTGDQDWYEAREDVFRDCLASLEVRDHPDPVHRNGIMSVDSTRCLGGAEITTYDSLDESLGQARASTYLGLKTSAAYALLAALSSDPEDRQRSALQAEKGIATLLAHAGEDGVFPALLEGAHPSIIIPVIEGLVFFDRSGLWEEWMAKPDFAALVSALASHLDKVLVPGVCLFSDGGWKLSSTSQNSWLSKIYLCQHIARKILKQADLSAYEEGDRAHVDWLLHPESLYWAWSDQIVSGIARGSKYYPRGVTSILWLDE